MASHSTPSSSNIAVDTIEAFYDILLNSKYGVVTVKPRVFFGIIERLFPTPPVYSAAMPSSQIGSITTLEASLLCSLILINKPKKIFEFGTFLGYTTALFLYNTSEETQIFSLDLPNHMKPSMIEQDKIDWEKVKSDDVYNDSYLSQVAHTKGEVFLRKFLNESRLHLIKIDSQEFNKNVNPQLNSIDYIFIDGGHSHKIASIDTQNSLEMLSDHGIVIWHDYASRLHTSVTNVVNDFAENKLVIHIESTMLALYVKSPENFPNVTC